MALCFSTVAVRCAHSPIRNEDMHKAETAQSRTAILTNRFKFIPPLNSEKRTCLFVKETLAGKNRVAGEVHSELAEASFVTWSRNVRKMTLAVP